MKALACRPLVLRSGAAAARAAALILAVTGLAGCGDDDKPSLPGVEASLFLGSWQVTAGSLSCGAMTVPLTGETVAVTAAADAPLQATVRGCAVKMDLGQTQANARAPQKCMVMVTVGGLPLSVELTVTDGKFVAAKAPGTNRISGVLDVSGDINFAGTAMRCQAMTTMDKS